MKNTRSISFLVVYVIVYWTQAQATTFTSTQNGSWSDALTWGGIGVPGNGDEVIINHDITLNGNIVVGKSQAQNSPSPSILISGKLLLSGGSTLVCRGDIKLSPGELVLEAGATLELDASLSPKPDSTIYQLIISPTIGSNALLRAKGSLSFHCQIRSHSGAAPAQITDGGVPCGGRIIANYCDFFDLNNFKTYIAWQYNPTTAIDTILLTNCVWQRCGEIRTLNNHLQPAGTYINFTSCIWRNSLVNLADPWTGIIILCSDSGATAILRDCDFDRMINLLFARDYTIENNVFREGFYHVPYQWVNSKWKSFKNNFVRFINDGDIAAYQYGCTIEDCFFIKDPPGKPAYGNPHFPTIKNGNGTTIVRGCVFYYTAGSNYCEGDANIVASPGSGLSSENKVIIERNIFLPNIQGPEGTNSIISSNGFGLVSSDTTLQLVFKRNTIYSSWVGGCNFGENISNAPGQIKYVKSNLFIGNPTSDGFKMHNLGKAVPDVILAAGADYNGGYRLASGSMYVPGVSGKGYEQIPLTGPTNIGQHDIDDTDPLFVDNTRTPISWDNITGGQGTMSGTMDKLSPGGGYTVQDVLEYIREGFRPQNSVFHNAGDPADSSPDIGAVDMNITTNVGLVSEKKVKTIVSPNPANATAKLEWIQERGENVKITLYDILGNEITTIHEGFYSAGLNSISIDLNFLSNGIYLLQRKNELTKLSVCH